MSDRTCIPHPVIHPCIHHSHSTGGHLVTNEKVFKERLIPWLGKGFTSTEDSPRSSELEDDNGNITNVFPICPIWTIEILSPDQSPTKVTGHILHSLVFYDTESSKFEIHIV